MKKIFLLFTISLIGPIFSMKIEDVDLSEEMRKNSEEIHCDLVKPNVQMGEQYLNKYQRTWPFSICPEMYRDESCNYNILLVLGGAIGWIMPTLLAKVLISTIGYCVGGTCKEACEFTWVGYNSCEGAEGCVTAVQSIHTGLLATACLVGTCAQMPCFGSNGCQCRVTRRSN